MLADVLARVEFLGGAFAGHRSDEAEDGFIEPGAVVLADDGPCDAGVAVGIAAVELVAVVEIDGPFEGSSGVGRPLEDLLGPVPAGE